jgi:hypothetical protein
VSDPSRLPAPAQSRLQAALRNRYLIVGLFVAVIVVAALVRAWPWFTAHTFGGEFGYDDGVYYGTADNLLHGVLPYRNFVDVEPPLGSILLLPFAVVGTIFGSRVGMETARVGFLVVSLANVTLIWRYAMRHARCAYPVIVAVVASLAYAVFPASVAAEHTLFLEPLLSLGLLIGGTLLLDGEVPGGRPLTQRRCIVIGVVLAATVLVKPAAVGFVIAALAWLMLRGLRREALLVLGGLVATGVVVSAPFFALAPHAFFEEAIKIQLARPATGGFGVAGRLSDLLGLTDFLGHTAATVLIVPAVLAVAVAIVWLWRRDVAARFWLITGVVIMVGFQLSASYFEHYANLITPIVAVSAGGVADLALRRMGARTVARLSPVPMVTLLVLATLFGMAAYGTWVPLAAWRGQGDIEAIGSMVPPGTCVFSANPTLTIAANLYKPPTPSCPGWVDNQGEALVLSEGHYPKDFYPAGILKETAWQNGIVGQMKHAQLILVRLAPRKNSEWSKQVQDYVFAHFRLARRWRGSYHWQVWARKR